MPARWYRRLGPACNLLGRPELWIAAAVAALYARTLGFGLVFDDHSLLGADGPLWVGGAWIPYRPLRHASFWLDRHVGGGAAWAYHLGNVVLHATASVLVVRLCRRAGASAAVALACASVFALHPLGVEAVAYVSGRRDLLAGVLGLAAVIAWTGGGRSSALAILFALLAVASKEAALLVLPLLFAASACGLGMPIRRATGPLTAATIAGLALPIAYGARGPLAPTGSIASNLSIAGEIARHYARNLVAPVSLSVDYPALHCGSESCAALLTTRGEITGLVLVAAVAGCFGLLAARVAGRSGAASRARATGSPGAGTQADPLDAENASVNRRGGGIRSRDVREDREVPHRSDWLRFSIVWVMSWVIAVSFVIGAHEPGADRHAYPLLAALAVLAAASVSGLRPIVRAGSIALLLLWLAWAVSVAHARISMWQDDLTLWEHEACSAQASARAHHNLAAELAARQRYGRARRELRKALAIDDRYWPSHLGLAGIDCVKGRMLSARSRLEAAARHGAPPEQVAALRASCEQRAATQ